MERRKSADRTHEHLLEAQNRVLELVARGAPLAESLDVLLREIEKQTPGMLSSILLLDPDGVHVRHAAAPSLPADYRRAIDGEPIGPKAGSCGTAAYRHEAVVVEDITTDPLWESYRDVATAHGLRACWSTPIFDGQKRVLGTFAMYFREPGRPTDRHRRLIEVTTYTAAVAIVAHRERQAARDREIQLEEAQRIAHLGSYEWDPRSNTVNRSRELFWIFGLTPDQFAPTFEAYLERVHPEDRARTRETIERSARERSAFDFEERIVLPDGSVRHLRSQGHWIGDQDSTRLIGICQDITERKRTEEQLRRSDQLRTRNEELKAFAYMVSHDLKAPLRRIAGYGRELAGRHRASLNERGMRCVDEIVEGTRNLDRLVEDLLEYSRVDAQKSTVTQVDLRQVVDDILRDRSEAIRAHGIQVEVDLAATAVGTWERGLVQALTNIVDNAFKYSQDAGPPVVRISSQETPEAVRIMVTDNGIGFDMRHHDRIFGLFTRLKAHEHVEGTGAGLAIVKKIAEKMGGRVWAESAPGAGASFYLELPKLPARVDR